MTAEPKVTPPDPGEDPGYEEPWQAQAFVCAIELSRAGLFSWREWSEALGAEIRSSPALPDETATAAYYRQVLDTLERLISAKGAFSAAEISERIEAWRRAYHHTPHGQPVELSNARRAHEADANSEAARQSD